MAARPDGPAQLGVQGLDLIRGVDDPADIEREGEERDQLRPVPPPGQGDRRVFEPPFARGEGIQGLGVGVLGLVDALERSRDRLAILVGCAGIVAEGRVSPQHKSSALRIRCTMQVWTWARGKTAVMASGKPFRPSTTAMRMSSTPRFLSSVITRSQNLPPSSARRRMIRSMKWARAAAREGRLLDPQAQDLLAAIGLRPIPRRYRVRGQGGEAASGEEVKGFWVRTTAWA